MNRRKNIYRGIDKRRRERNQKILLIIICVLVVGGYGFSKLKKVDLTSLLPNKESKEVDKDTYSYDDVVDELEKDTKEEDTKEEDTKEETEEKDEGEGEEKETETSEEVKLAMVEDWNMYTIQVASIEDDSEISKIEKELEDKKIPFSIVEVDGLKKVQTHTYLKEDDTRNHLEDVKKHYPEAFVSKLEIPLLSLEYTEEYSYIEKVSNNLNQLIESFEKESELLTKEEKDIKQDEYTKILEDRSKIVSNMKKEVESIDYEGANAFKENLLKYANDLNDNIDSSTKSIEKKDYYTSKSLFSSSMQGYYNFINSIKAS